MAAEPAPTLYSSLLVTQELGELRCITLRTLLLEIGARDLKNLTEPLVAEFKLAGFIHVMPESELNREREIQKEQLMGANARYQQSAITENAARRELEALMARRNGFFRTVLRFFGLGRSWDERDAGLIQAASLHAAQLGQVTREDDSASSLMLSRSAYLGTFAKLGDSMIALSETGKQVAADLKNESDQPFSDFASKKVQPQSDSNPGTTNLSSRTRSSLLANRGEIGRLRRFSFASVASVLK